MTTDRRTSKIAEFLEGSLGLSETQWISDGEFTGCLRVNGAARNDLCRGADLEIGRQFHNRAENPHLPYRPFERTMLRFPRMQTLQKFALIHASVQNQLPTERQLLN